MDYAPTHYGIVSFFDSDYRIELKEHHTGFRPTFEILSIQSSLRPGVTVWHPRVPGNNNQPDWYVGKHLMAAHNKRDNILPYPISYRLDGILWKMYVRRIPDPQGA